MKKIFFIIVIAVIIIGGWLLIPQDSPQAPQETILPEPIWIRYEDKGAKFFYAATFCGTSWEEEWERKRCKEGVIFKPTTVTRYDSASIFDGEWIDIHPYYRSGSPGDIGIFFISKEQYEEHVLNKNLSELKTEQGYTFLVEPVNIGPDPFVWY